MFQLFKKMILAGALSCFLLPSLRAQCTTVNVNLSANPDSTWFSPPGAINRLGQCCSAPSNEDCVTFNITTSSNTVGISFDLTGAPAFGSFYWQINCGANHSLRDTICLTGSSPYQITFCKNGNNPYGFIIRAISKPVFPANDTIRLGCSKTMHTYGIRQGTATWNSIYPGAPGAYNSYLSCTNCTDPVVTPTTGAPPYVDYQVCGMPIATQCGYILRICGVVRIYFLPPLTGTVTPNPATFCNIGVNPGVTLTASASGGTGNYTYTWRNSANTVVGHNSTYFANSQGQFTVEIGDGLSSSSCPNYFASTSVSVGSVPVVNAGPDQAVCSTDSVIYLHGTTQYSTGGVWSGGAGTFNPGPGYLNTTYKPTSSEILAGYVILNLTSTGAGGGCPNSSDLIKIRLSDTLKTTLSSSPLSCNNSTTTINSSVTGGIAPILYHWSTGATSSSISAGQGTYILTVTDSAGCFATASKALIAPPALAIVMSATPATTNGGNDGTATASVSGGTPSYTYSWSPGGQTTSTATGLSYGIYTVHVTDSKGCTITGSVVVNEPRCNGFAVSVNNTSLNCFGNNNGSLTATVTSGTPAFIYSWNSIPSQNGSVLTGVSAGSYVVTVIDAVGCMAVGSGVVSQPPMLTDNVTHTDATTIGGNDGTASANPAGGTPGYTYSWSNGPVTQNVTGLTAGTYSVTVTDNKGCQQITPVTIAQPPCNGLVAGVNTTNVGCFGGTNGTAAVFITHGVPPYTISWSTGATSAYVSGLSAGNYSVTVSDNNGCSDVIPVTITEPSPLSIGLVGTNVSCYGLSNGSINLNVTGGTYPYSFIWSNGMSGEDLSSIGAGTYTVTVTDVYGCQASGSVTITVPAQLVANYTSTNITCYGGTNGSINLNVSGGTPVYSYAWSNGSTSQNLSGITSGSYVVNVRDANGCSIQNPVSVFISQPDSISIDSIHASCPAPGSATTSIQVYSHGGVNPYAYSLDGGFVYQTPGQSTFTVNTGATYTVVLKDSSHCVSPASRSITVDSTLRIRSLVYSTCFNPPATTTLVTVNPQGGAGAPYQVSFNGGSTFQASGVYTATLNIGSNYPVVVMDRKGCLSATDTAKIPSALSATLVATTNFNGFNISCNGGTNGAFNLTPSGGSSPYTYSWSNGATTEDQSGLAAGTYSVTVTDAGGCTFITSITLTEPPALNVTAAVTSNFNGQNISCNGNADGQATATPSGGTGAYTYSWSNGQTTAVATGLNAGTYVIQLTDANGCSTSTGVTLTQPALLTAPSAITSNFNGQNVSCFGSSDGQATASPAGGTGVYTYSWSNGQTTAINTNLAAGSYTVTVHDANGCSATSSVTLTQPSQISASSVITSNFNGQDVSCFGSSNGTAQASGSGGTGAYAYSWTNGQTVANATGLSAGSYTVTVIDVNGCSTTSSVTLTQPTVLSSTASVISNYNGQDVSCFGSTNGSALASPAGGTGAYTYSWSNGQTTANATSLGAGTYTVNVQDLNGCSTSATVTLTQPTVLGTSTAVNTNFNGFSVSCFGSTNGQATTTPTGGTGAYTYSWSNGQNTAAATNLGAGTYTVTVTDVNGCSVSNSITLTQPVQLLAPSAITSNYNGQNVSCFGSTDGQATATPSGGTGAYTYSWSNGANTAIDNNLGAGSYTVTVQDANGCSASSSVVLGQPALLTASSVVTSNFNGQDVTCFGATNGSAQASATGGTTSYNYSWSNGQTVANATSLGAGTYTVVVTDVNGCSASSTVTLGQPAQVTVSTSVISNYNGQDISCYGATNGSALATVNGGTGAYTYSWSNGQTVATATSLGAGTYLVQVHDLNGCGANSSITLSQPAQLSATATITTHYNGYNVSCAGSTNGAVNLTVNGGTPVYNTHWSNGANTQNISGIGAGTYLATVVDTNGCSTTVSVTLTEPVRITLGGQVRDVSCNGDSSGAITLNPAGGVPVFTYQWSNGATSQNLANLFAGAYTVIATDANGCRDTVAYTVKQSFLINTGVSVQNINCHGGSDGVITVSTEGGNAPYNYSWSNGGTTNSQTGLTAGTYYVTVTDNTGCTLRDTIVVVQPDSLQASLAVSMYPNGHNISLYGATDGWISLTVSAGTAPYTYNWSNSATTQNLTDVGAGDYTVIISDSHGCTLQKKVTLEGPFNLQMPTGFTPNADGSNDFFVVHGIESYPQNHLTIFNRWGNIVYETSGYHNQWNGLNNSGNELPDGTYFAILDIESGKIVLQGYVDLRRSGK